jgi:DNA (cytosine-5)-methyltransferase 1
MDTHSKPVALDLYCCQGGATRGLQDAGFYVIGVDIEPQPNYCGDEFIQADVITYLGEVLFGPNVRDLGERPALVHASPPCQARTKAQKIQGREHPALIAPTRELLRELGVPYVIENVVAETPALDTDPLKDPILLCGTMFGLRTYRHRQFEASFPLTAPEHPRHERRQVKMGRPIGPDDFYQAIGNFSGVEIARQDMEVPWMNRDGIRECIPPAYAEYVGKRFLASA